MALLPNSYLINLDRSTERLTRFRERNRHLANVMRFFAVDGGAASRSDLEETGYASRDLTHLPGALGCALSHVKLWEKAAAEDCSITVFEDDAVLSYHFERCAEQILSALPTDWDFIAWGNNFPPAFIWVDIGVSKARLMPYGGKTMAKRRGVEGISAQRIFLGRDQAPSCVRLQRLFDFCCRRA